MTKIVDIDSNEFAAMLNELVEKNKVKEIPVNWENKPNEKVIPLGSSTSEYYLNYIEDVELKQILKRNNCLDASKFHNGFGLSVFFPLNSFEKFAITTKTQFCKNMTEVEQFIKQYKPIVYKIGYSKYANSYGVSAFVYEKEFIRWTMRLKMWNSLMRCYTAFINKFKKEVKTSRLA